ncbi:transposase [Roseixanthobacter psychrophilus]|uniref:transposase n=1 Tax=Roseixanthobacter psychrophilus TaxID=3119917 RepID=UPI003D258332
MTDDTLLPFCFPAVGRKKVTAGFDGGRITSDGGVMLLAAAERRLQLADRLAAAIHDPRDARRVRHAMADILRARIFAIACGYEDANDLDRLRSDPAFKLACGRLPDSGVDLCSQPTCSRLENLPDLRTVIRLGDLSFDIRPHILRRHQADHVTQGLCRPPNMMGAPTSLHCHRARRQFRQQRHQAVPRHATPQNHCTALVQPNDAHAVKVKGGADGTLAVGPADVGRTADIDAEHVGFGQPCGSRTP